MCWKAGRRKPHVLPEPVRATEIRSLPWVTIGQETAWMGEGTLKPALVKAASTFGPNPASQNRIIGSGGVNWPLPSTVWPLISIPCFVLNSSGPSRASSSSSASPSAGGVSVVLCDFFNHSDASDAAVACSVFCFFFAFFGDAASARAGLGASIERVLGRLDISIDNDRVRGRLPALAAATASACTPSEESSSSS